MKHDELERLARAYDIQPSYKDLQENEISASPESILAALRSMGVIETYADMKSALRTQEETCWRWSMEPVTVAWLTEPAGRKRRGVTIKIRLPETALGASCHIVVEMEDGTVLEQDRRLGGLKVTGSADIGRERFVEVSLGLPALPAGYHRLLARVGEQEMRSWVISAPRKAYSAGHGPAWGVFLPLYALHSPRSWGIGDYTDLRRLIEWAGGRGASFVATLPLLPSFLDTPFEPSPYQPVSRLFWNEVFVDPEAPLAGEVRPEVDAELAARARSLTATRSVDYAKVMALKRRALAAQAKTLRPDSKAGRAMASYLDSRPEVRDYAAFRAAIERLGPDWREWPERQRNGELDAGDFDAKTARYYEYAQWRAHSQMFEARDVAEALDMRSYLDLPVGVHQQGYDAWRYQNVFAQGQTVGSPPDLLSTNGQNWGFQPLVPRALRETGYEYVVRYLRHYFASAKMLRIDHAIGLHRLYWIPEGATGRDGVFVRQPAEEMYAVLCLESARNRAVVVAEDLGLVPPEVGRGLKAHGISGMYVQMFEMTGRKDRPTRRPNERAVGSLSTHDLPKFAAYWQDEDLKERERLGILAPERVAEELAVRKRQKRALLAHLKARGLVADESDMGQVYRGSTALLAESDAEWVLLDLEDTWGETAAHNLPGTSSEQHSNWVARAAYGLEDFDSVKDLKKAIDTVKLYRVGRTSPRADPGSVQAPSSGRGPIKEGV